MYVSPPAQCQTGTLQSRQEGMSWIFWPHTEGDTVVAPANKASYEHSTNPCSFIALPFASCPACLLARMREHVSDQQTDPCLLSRCEQVHPAQLRGRDI